MLFRKKNKKQTVIRLLAGESVLYDGLLLELPLTEETIIEHSILFFKDSNPCYIHRGAVRARLTCELEACLQSSSAPSFETLRKQTGLANLDTILFEDRCYHA